MLRNREQSIHYVVINATKKKDDTCCQVWHKAKCYTFPDIYVFTNITNRWFSKLMTSHVSFVSRKFPILFQRYLLQTNSANVLTVTRLKVCSFWRSTKWFPLGHVCTLIEIETVAVGFGRMLSRQISASITYDPCKHSAGDINWLLTAPSRMAFPGIIINQGSLFQINAINVLLY